MPPSLPRPRKRLGQHFLVDKNIVRKIVDLANLQPGETVLEVGAGRGILTSALCQVASRIIAVEVDPGLVRHLQQTLSPYPNLEVVGADALKYPIETLLPKTVVVANLPYYISTPLLFKFFMASDRIVRMVLMLQLEVAKRMVAQTGTREFGILSVLTQYFSKARLAFQVSRTCFRPCPDVASAVVHVDLKAQNPAEADETDGFIRTVRAAFGHRRKTLSNSFRDAGFLPSDLHRAMALAGIDGTRRAETLTLREFRELAHALSPMWPLS